MLGKNDSSFLEFTRNYERTSGIFVPCHFGRQIVFKILKHLPYHFFFQVLIQVPQRGCVITWDFDILKGDVTFTVFRCKNSLTAEPHHSHHISGATGGIGSVQYIDKTMQVGPDLSIVEPPHICRDGDSVQVGNIFDQMSRDMRFPTMWYVRPAKPQICLRTRAV